jgi:hypothetical protein
MTVGEKEYFVSHDVVGPLNLLRVLEGLAQAVASEDRSTAEEWRGQLVDHLGRHSVSLRRAVNELYEASGKWQRTADYAPDSKKIQKLISRVISLLSKRS